MSNNSAHSWKFFRAGGVDQVTFRNGSDVVNIDKLDQKLWFALAMPTRGIEFDTRTLDLLDTDKDGRIRPPELIAAAKWAAGALRNPDDLIKGGHSLPLASIKDEGVLAGAKRILTNLGKAEAKEITLADVADTAKIFVETKFNGDGIVPADSAGDDATKKAIEDIIAALGSVPDRSGKPGVNQAKVDQFFAECQALHDWQAKADADKAVLPLDASTAAASAAVKGVKTKVDDYFARCRLAAFDTRAATLMNRAETEYVALAAKDLTQGAEDIAKLPLARVEAGKPLPLGDGVNPAWAGTMATLAASAVTPLLGASKTSLTEADWMALQAKLAAHDAWAASKPATSVEKLGLPRVRELLKSKARETITSLVSQDAALEAENAQIATVEKLLHCQRDLVKLLNNYVSFADFYSRRGAIFQAGTLYLDARSCNLCVDVTDPGKHGTLASMSGAYLAYCDLTRPGGQKRTVVAAFTDGDSDNLIVGRNGVFYDRKGQDWDATISKIISAPISIREAFWLPYKKFVRMIEETIAKRAAAADEEANKKVAAAAVQAANADKTKPAEKPPEPKKLDVGIIAAMGVALGSIGTFLGLLLGKFLDLGMWMPLGILAVILMISGPSMLLAWLKLRKRNLAPILDANGWAINTVAKMNVPFGASLTDMPRIPAGAERSLDDPFAEKQRPWGFYITLIVLVVLGYLYSIGKLDGALPESIRKQTLFKPKALAAAPAAPAVEAPKPN